MPAQDWFAGACPDELIHLVPSVRDVLVDDLAGRRDFDAAVTWIVEPRRAYRRQRRAQLSVLPWRAALVERWSWDDSPARAERRLW